MTKNKHQTALVFVLALLFLIPVSIQADEQSVSTSASYVETAKKNPVVSTDEALAVNVGLLDRYAHLLSEAPPGTVYLWSESNEGQVSDALELVDGAGIATETNGVVAIPASALKEEKQVRVSFLRFGRYQIKAAYFSDGAPFIPTQVREYKPYLLTGADSDADVAVGSDSSDVRSLRVEIFGPKPIAPFEVPLMNGEATIDREISVRGDGITPTKVHVTFLNGKGMPAGVGKKVFFLANSPNLSLNPSVAEINRRGEAEVALTSSVLGRYRFTISFNEPPAIPRPEPTPDIVPPTQVQIRIGSDAFQVDGRTVHSGAAAIVRNGRTFVPLRVVAEGLAADVHYDEKTRDIQVVRGDRTIVLHAGQKTYKINGVQQPPMDAAPYLEGDVTMVPLRFIAEALQTEIIPQYNAHGLTTGVTLYSNGK